MSPKVDIGVACSGAQRPEWWNGVMSELLAEQRAGVEIGRIHAISSANPDHNKNAVIDLKRQRLTDANRNTILGGFLEGDSEWLWFLDDDTVPPKGALSQLLSLEKEAVGGVYVQDKGHCPPIAYLRQPNGLYAAIWQYPHGAIMQIDSIGMGCTLVHRSVFEKIRAEFRVMQRPNGSLYPVHRSKFGMPKGSTLKKDAPPIFVGDGYLCVKVVDWDENDERTFPYFAMEYCRTEDHHFWELAEQVGVKPFIDTTLFCKHLKVKGYGLDDMWPHRTDDLMAHLRPVTPEATPGKVEVLA